jgi:Ca2+:H+ antiporter
MSFFLGGIRYHDQVYNPAASRVYSSMMMLATFALLVPSAFHSFFQTSEPVIDERQLDLTMAIILLVAYGLNILFMLKTHPEVFKSMSKTKDEETHGHWSVARALATLCGASIAAAWMSEILVGAAEGTGEALGMSEVFIGMILLSVIGGAAESGSAMAMARKNKMDLSLSIAMGSCVQIALFIAPVLVILSYVTAPEPLYLEFSRAETGLLFLGVLIATVVAGDGKSNWYKGVQLITVYLIIAVSLYLIPS